MVLSTALFDKPAFKNLVCNGLVLADDGKKMSKRLKNYPVSQHPLSQLLQLCTTHSFFYRLAVLASQPFLPIWCHAV